MATIINGVTTAQEVKDEIAEKVTKFAKMAVKYRILQLFWSEMTVPARPMSVAK